MPSRVGAVCERGLFARVSLEIIEGTECYGAQHKLVLRDVGECCGDNISGKFPAFRFGVTERERTFKLEFLFCFGFVTCGELCGKIP
ncbi:MAG: hypothetical protein PHQ60_04590 [Sideroxydans sp.]|nr:hypothetical protein [Sideroxydans sp.]